MKTISSPSLADIELDLPIRAVTDDLAAFTDRLSLSGGVERGYARFAAEASSFIDAEGGPSDTGQLILAIDPAAMGGHWFDERMRALCHAIEDQPGSRLPGIRRLNLRAKARAEGIEVSDELLG